MNNYSSVVIGYHGCRREIGEKIISGSQAMIQSEKKYDWLGPGAYFWENDPLRAFEWAKSRHTDPYVLGAAINLGNCLDLTLRENLNLLSDSYKSLKKIFLKAKQNLPKNKPVAGGSKHAKLLRYLDCAVIQNLHQAIDELSNKQREQLNLYPFDTVRGLFIEGKPVYPGAKFYSLTHTQIAVRNTKNIIGVFNVKQ